MSLTKIYITIILVALITFFTRAFSFLFFRKAPGETMEFFEKNIPPMVMLILVIYCLKDITWTAAPFGIPELVCILVTALLHIWKGNSMISIFSGTILYMIILQTGILSGIG